MLFFWKYVYTEANRLGFKDTTGPLARGTLFHVGRAHLDAQQWARENGKDETKILGPIEAMQVCAERISEFGLAPRRGRCSTPTGRLSAGVVPRHRCGGAARSTSAGRSTVAWIASRRSRATDLRSRHEAVRLDAERSANTRCVEFFGHVHRSAFTERLWRRDRDMVGEMLVQRRPIEAAPLMLRNFPGLIERAPDRIKETKRQCGTDPDAWARSANPDEQTCFGKYGQCACLELCRWGAKL
jgi:hypothetical protein